jgi:NAD(P)-dependent dehydrogenase (short-subunit alcohol dehydrogenase family)
MSHICPVCGYPQLSEPPRSLSGGGSNEICPSCGFEHGVDDDDKGQSYASAREAWRRGGMKWASKGQAQSKNWKAATQLAAVTPGKDAKFIVVTGCTRGCGRALAEHFIAQGHIVAGCGRNADEVTALRKKFGSPHDFTVVDVSDDDAVMRWASRLITTQGAPDLLVNNAAVIARNAPLWKVPAREVADTLAVNVGGTVTTIRHFAPAMIERGRGVIANFSSGWGRSTSPDVAIYCASKFAIEGLTQALAQELPRGVAVVALNPGIIDTEMLRSCFAGGASAYPKPADWAKRAGPFILALDAKDNGRSVDVSDVPAA